MKKVIIAEKPSVAKNIADALNVTTRKDGYFEGEGYLISWAFGHLLQLYDAKDYDQEMKGWKLERFPFIPQEFKYKIKSDGKNKAVVDAGAKKQLGIIKSLIRREDVESIISATDFDREGQVIADEIFLYLHPKKPIYRMLLNEWTPEEVKKGMQKLKPNEEMQSLQDAGMGRQWADWLIGINLTSVATVKYNAGQKKILNIGRVLLPTLKIIYDRDKEIESFKASVYYKLVTNLKTRQGEIFETTYYEQDQAGKENEKFEKKEVLEAIKEDLKGKIAKVIDKQVEAKKEYPPFLFNLSNLQGHITSKYKGWTSDKVLKVAQALYEKKLITYPRTGSLALEESLKERAKKVLEVHKKGLPYENQIKFVTSKRIFDNKKVESHSAITPTYLVAKGLSADEQIVYQAIKDRFLMQFLPVAEFEETKVTLKAAEEKVKGVLISKGRVQRVEGWRVVEKIESKDTLLPQINLHEEVKVGQPKVNEIVKKPPKLHTEKTLLRIMETCGKNFKSTSKNSEQEQGLEEDQNQSQVQNQVQNQEQGKVQEEKQMQSQVQGIQDTQTEDYTIEESNEEPTEEMMASILSGFSIGTPATRAETIKKLKDVGYIEAKGKSLTCTPLGKSLVEIFPVRQLLDLEYTGRLEKTLSDIEKGKFKKQDFLNLIENFTTQAVASIKADTAILKQKIETPKGSEVIGVCPVCGNAIVESERAFGCVNWRAGCKYTIWKNDKYIQSLGKEVTKPMVELLLKNGKVGFRNLKGEKGTTFAAYLKYVQNEKTGRWNWELEFI